MVVPTLKGLCGRYVDRCLMEGRLDDIGDDTFLYNYIMDSESRVNTEMMMLHDNDTVLYVIKERVLEYIKKLGSVVSDNSNNCLVYGEVQSGKTKLIIACCWWFQHVYRKTSFLFIRNITQDYYQFNKRVMEFNREMIQNREYYLGCSYLKDIDEIPDGVVVCLRNKYQLERVVRLMYDFRDNEEGIFTRGSRYVRFNGVLPDSGIIRVNGNIYKYTSKNGGLLLGRRFRSDSGVYMVCEMNEDPNRDYYMQVDEVDSYGSSVFMDKLEGGCSFMVGYTATPFFNLLYGGFRRVVKMDRPSNYVGIGDIDINVDKELFEVYDAFMSKKSGMMLHNTVSYRKKQHEVAVDLMKRDGLVCVVHNGNGVYVYSRKKSYKGYSIGGYSVNGKNYRVMDRKGYSVHRISRVPISVVLQMLKDDGISHVSIISRLLASRGMSYVSYDYGWHITDQILYVNRSTSLDKMIQYMRCCGVWNNDRDITLWTSKVLKKKILERYELLCDVMGLYKENIVYESTRTVMVDRVYEKSYGVLFTRSGYGCSWVKFENGYGLVVK